MRDKLSAHRQDKPQPLSNFRDDLPAELVGVIERMMDKDPARRYQTPEEVARALRPFLAVRPANLVLRRRWMWIAAAATTVLVLAGLLATAAVVRYVLRSRSETILAIFGPDEKPLTRDGIAAEDDGWRIEAKAPRTVPLFEIAEPGVEDCQVIYRARLKTENMQGKAYLEMWCRFPGKGEFFSKGILNPVSGTTDWASYQTPFFLKKGERPDLIKLNVVIEGAGTLWIKDITVRKAGAF
jgi:hypothetical protein